MPYIIISLVNIKRIWNTQIQVLEPAAVSAIGMGEDLPSLCPSGLPPSLCPDNVGLRRAPAASEDIFTGKGGKRSVRDLLRQKEIAGMTGP
jgi:hypothetical protein